MSKEIQLQIIEGEILNDELGGGSLVNLASINQAFIVYQSMVERFLSEADIKDGSRATYGRQLINWRNWLNGGLELNSQSERYTQRAQEIESRAADAKTPKGRATIERRAAAFYDKAAAAYVEPTEEQRQNQADRLRKLALGTLSKLDVMAYRDDLSSDFTSHSVSNYLTAVRRFYKWIESEGGRDITKGVKAPKKPKGHRKDALSGSQAREILDTIAAGDELSTVRDYAIFNLMVRGGLRDIEVSRANIDNLRSEQGQAVLYVQGKGRDEADDYIILTAEAAGPLEAYLSARKAAGERLKDDSPLFASLSARNYGGRLSTRSISRIIKEAMRAAGLDSKRLTAHSLRHTAATLSLIGGADIFQVKSMLRHTDIRSTQIYAHNLERVAQAAERSIQF
jgi:integrase/recombinase XerD